MSSRHNEPKQNKSQKIINISEKLSNDSDIENNLRVQRNRR
jgi:hypothetical protein